ncbi:unnamed protein product [Caenorhabditis auriculariae]|uniref:Uncharacterized protein n=1 Tax=Caenorhabditis auriculariae TaxID=2777116 RepID=A0A8S1GXW9_9PELO|nr:unnamed protein product [Caenorhabditis auriculariae]
MGLQAELSTDRSLDGEAADIRTFKLIYYQLKKDGMIYVTFLFNDSFEPHTHTYTRAHTHKRRENDWVFTREPSCCCCPWQHRQTATVLPLSTHFSFSSLSLRKPRAPSANDHPE